MGGTGRLPWEPTKKGKGSLKRPGRTCGVRRDVKNGDSLSVDAVALEQGLGVGVGEAVVVPQGAGCLQELCLCCALAVSEESWKKKKNG